MKKIAEILGASKDYVSPNLLSGFENNINFRIPFFDI